MFFLQKNKIDGGKKQIKFLKGTKLICGKFIVIPLFIRVFVRYIISHYSEDSILGMFKTCN